MKAVIQRVKEASVRVGPRVTGQIRRGIVVLLGIAREDTEEDLDYMVRKVTELRMFPDGQDKMNLSVKEIEGQILVVSQFTICGDCRKGRRPSFDSAADPAKAEQFYERFIDKLRSAGLSVQTGEFRAMMDVSLINDGPVTFILSTP